MKSEIAAYLAGLVDGEGTIGLSHRVSKPHWKTKNMDHYQVQLDVISNTNHALILAVEELLVSEGFEPKHASWQPVSKRAVQNCKMGHRIFLLRTEQKRRFLESIFPYLIAKKEQAKLVLEFLSRRSADRKVKTTERERLLYARLRELNQRGRTSEPVTTGRGAPDTAKLQSELHGDMQRSAEMTDPAKFH
jgi:hypothetical protein